MEQTRKQRTFEEALRAINVINNLRGFDVEVYGMDTACVYAPIKLTSEGRKYFGKALSAKMDDENGLMVWDEDETAMENALELIMSLAGYCTVENYERWFEGDDAEEI